MANPQIFRLTDNCSSYLHKSLIDDLDLAKKCHCLW